MNKSNSAWSRIERLWPKDLAHRDLEWGKIAYINRITGDRMEEALVKSVQKYLESLPSGRKAMRLDSFISKDLWQNYLDQETLASLAEDFEPRADVPVKLPEPKPPAVPLVTATQEFTPPSAEATAPEVAKALEFFGNWPLPWKSKVKHVEAQALKLHRAGDLQKVVDSARYFMDRYADPTSGISRCQGLVKFMTEGWESWYEGAQSELSSDELAEFELAWADFPHKWHVHPEVDQDKAKQRGGMLWKRFIKPEERMEFRFAVRGHRIYHIRKETEVKFIPRWDAFLAVWRQVSRSSFGAAVGRAWGKLTTQAMKAEDIFYEWHSPALTEGPETGIALLVARLQFENATWLHPVEALRDFFARTLHARVCLGPIAGGDAYGTDKSSNVERAIAWILAQPWPAPVDSF